MKKHHWSFDDKGAYPTWRKCQQCGSQYLSTIHFMLKDGDAVAIVWIEAHRHDGKPEIFFTANFGPWWQKDNTNAKGHTTFSYVYHAIADEETMVFSLINPPSKINKPRLGRVLRQEEARSHPLIHEVWEVADFIMENDLVLHDYLHHPVKNKLKVLLKLYPRP